MSAEKVIDANLRSQALVHAVDLCKTEIAEGSSWTEKDVVDDAEAFYKFLKGE